MTNLDRPYDPDPLEDGARVRIRLSGECPGPDDCPHVEAWNGHEGRVTEMFHGPAGCGNPTGHIYMVEAELPHPNPAYGWVRCLDHFARIELERLP